MLINALNHCEALVTIGFCNFTYMLIMIIIKQVYQPGYGNFLQFDTPVKFVTSRKKKVSKSLRLHKVHYILMRVEIISRAEHIVIRWIV